MNLYTFFKFIIQNSSIYKNRVNRDSIFSIKIQKLYARNMNYILFFQQNTTNVLLNFVRQCSYILFIYFLSFSTDLITLSTSSSPPPPPPHILVLFYLSFFFSDSCPSCVDLLPSPPLSSPSTPSSAPPLSSVLSLPLFCLNI